METATLSAKGPAGSTDVRRAARGDVEAFERLYRAHAGRIHSLARRLVGASEADDATQEIFLRAWRRLETFRGEAAFGTWLARLGKNVLLSRLDRSRRIDDRNDPLEDEIAVQAPSAIPAMDCEAALQRLPEGARAVLVLHDIEGHTHQEIAKLLGVQAGTSKSQLHRARALLRELLTADSREIAR